MPPSAPHNHDPTLSHAASNAQQQSSSQTQGVLPQNLSSADLSNVQLASQLGQDQLMSILRNLPSVFNKLTEAGKEDAAQTLSNLAQQQPFPAHQMPVHYPPGGPGGIPGINDPGPSSHPRGPPNLGQLSAVAMQAAPASVGVPQQQQQPQQQQVSPLQQPQQPGREEQGRPEDQGGVKEGGSSPPATSSGGRTRGSRSATMGSDEWSRQRKDNHKEVERRRRGNINEGINELGRIVPNGSGEKAKGAILARAVQYIHHLKENEARNIEKWTLEKLLMDQAMGDLQAQLEEYKRLWDEERMAHQRAENELEVLRGVHGLTGGQQGQVKQDGTDASAAGGKRRSEERDGGVATEGDERDGKRQRTD